MRTFWLREFFAQFIIFFTQWKKKLEGTLLRTFKVLPFIATNFTFSGYLRYDTHIHTQVLEVTVDQILASIKVGEDKTPRPNKIPNKAIIVAAVKKNPELFIQMIQVCLNEDTFPKTCKIQKLVLFP